MSQSSPAEQPELIRGVGLAGATTLNMIDMIGVGPFITIPLIVSAAGGPQAMLGWIVGAVLALCDGLVWAELGAAMPSAGGSYRYLKEIYGPKTLGRLLSFLFIWQLSFSAPLSVASGCIGLAHYAGYLWPGLEHILAANTLQLAVPLVGMLEARVVVMPATFVAIGTCALRRVSALPAHHGHRQAGGTAVGCRDWIGPLAWILLRDSRISVRRGLRFSFRERFTSRTSSSSDWAQPC